MGLLDIGQIAAAVDNIKRRAKLGLLDPALAFMRAQEDAAAHNKAQDESIAGLRSALPETRKQAIEARSADAVDMASNFMGGGLLGAIKPVYHGSPHRFDKFDMSKIGTGEGAQMFGHGLYFADHPAVARGYKNTLEAGSGNAPVDVAARIFRDAGGDTQKALSIVAERRKIGNMPGAAQKWDEIESLIKRGDPRGAVYTAELEWPAAQLAAGKKPLSPEDLLDWDAPLSQQSETIRKGLLDVAGVEPTDGMRLAGGGKLKVVDDPDFGKKFFLDWGDNRLMRLSASDVKNLIGTGAEGKSAYQALSTKLGGDAAASQYLRQRGIPGLRYLDGDSRGAGTGTRNYVIFDDALARILGRE